MAALKSRHSLAIYILLVGVVRHYGYLLAAPEDVGIVSKGLGGLSMLAVAPLIYLAAPSRFMLLVLAWWCFEALQTVICSWAFYIQPWAVPVGQSICSARIGFDLGAIGILCVAALLYRFHLVSSDDMKNGESKR